MLWNQLKMSELLKENMINCSFLSEDFSYETGVEHPCRTLGYYIDPDDCCVSAIALIICDRPAIDRR